MTNSLSKEKLHNLLESITPMSLKFIQKVGEFKGKQILLSNQQPEYLNKLQINAIINNTLASNAIDGINIRHERFIKLFEEIEQPSNEQESEVIRYIKNINLINSHYETLELSADLIIQLHKNLFGYKIGQGGKWRQQDFIGEKVNDDISSMFTLEPVNADNIPELIQDLCISYQNLINDSQLVDLIVMAAFVLDFTCIQPFSEGNGRIVSLLTQLLLYKQDYHVAKYIALDEIIMEHKSKYIYSFNKSSQGWYENKHKLSNWVEYFLWVIYSGYCKLDKQIYNIKSKRGAKSQQVKLIIDILPDTFKVAEITERCPGIARPTINKVLQELRDKKLLVSYSLGRDAVWKKQY